MGLSLFGLPFFEFAFACSYFVALAAAPLHTKVGGAAWVLLVVAGLFAGFCTVRQRGCQRVVLCDVAPTNAVDNVAQEALPQQSAQTARRAAYVWLCATALFALGTLGMGVYWHTHLDAHKETWRLLAVAVAVMAIATRLDASPSSRPEHRWLWQHACALSAACACILALGYVVQYGRVTPTNPIPWAAVVAMLCALLLPLVVIPQYRLVLRLALGLALVAGVLAVLLSESRGAYGIVVWVLGAGMLLSSRAIVQRLRAGAGLRFSPNAQIDAMPKLRWRAARRVLLWGLLGGVLMGGYLQLQRSSVPWTLANLQAQVVGRYEKAQAKVHGRVTQVKERMAVAVREARAAIARPDDPVATNTSVGARIFLWRLVWRDVPDHWLLGIGGQQRVATIQAEGERIGSVAVADLKHTHQEYLHALWDYGVIGLAALLALQIGMLTLAWMAHGVARWQLLGLWFVHASTGLSNVNFAHNYYSLMLALCMAAVLLGPWEPRAANATAKR